MTLKGSIVDLTIPWSPSRLLMDLTRDDGHAREGFVVPGTERHVRLIEVRTRTPEAIMGFHH